jgi:hypothetical protein
VPLLQELRYRRAPSHASTAARAHKLHSQVRYESSTPQHSPPPPQTHTHTHNSQPTNRLLITSTNAYQHPPLAPSLTHTPHPGLHWLTINNPPLAGCVATMTNNSPLAGCVVTMAMLLIADFGVMVALALGSTESGKLVRWYGCSDVRMLTVHSFLFQWPLEGATSAACAGVGGYSGLFPWWEVLCSSNPRYPGQCWLE